MVDAPSDAELAEAEETGAEEQPLDLTVDIKSPSACERHVTVTVPAAWGDAGSLMSTKPTSPSSLSV